MKSLFPLLAMPAVVTVQPLSSGEVLEPSVMNEVEHALDRAPMPDLTFSPADRAHYRLYETNGLSATEVAVALVSSQRRDGRWFVGTNEVTASAIRTLRRLSGAGAW